MHVDRDQHQREQKLRATLAGMRVWENTNRYYALTLTASVNHRPIWSAHSHFAGPSERFTGWERRIASIVDAAKMTALWDGIGQSWVVVGNRAELGLWVRLGGNALVEDGLAHEWLPRQVAPREVAPNGPTGFLVAESLTRQHRKRKPTRGLRKRVFQRDERSCRRCGRTDGEVTLSRHHVLPHSAGGLTQENNLVTLCEDCHTDCHREGSGSPAPDLLFGVLLAHELDRWDEDHDEAVRRHRRVVARLAA